MFDGHLDEQTLQRLADRDVDPDELKTAGWHLYKCRPCRRRLRDRGGPGAEVLQRLLAGTRPLDLSAPRDYSQIFESLKRSLHAATAAASVRSQRAEGAVRELLAAAPRRRRRLAAEGPDHATWEVAERLLAECRDTWSGDPQGAEELAELALAVAGRVEATPALENDLAARAWSFIGNCRRVASDLRGADAAFSRARELLERGSGDPLERARLLDLEASLLRARRRFVESERNLEAAVHLYETIGDRRGVARALVKRAMVLSYDGRPGEAVREGRRALALLEPAEEPRLHMVTSFNLAVCLHELGRYDEVERLLDALRPRVEEHGERGDRLRLRWFEGLLARDTGDGRRAEEVLRRVRGAYADAGIGYNAALVSLDLAVLLTDQGRTAEVRDLAAEMLPIFESREVQREAMAAFMLFQQAVAAETLTSELARKVATALRQGRDLAEARPVRPS